MLGGVVEIPLPGTAGGTAKMTLPAATQGGQVFRLRGKGFFKIAGPSTRGDLLCTVQVKIPSVNEADRADVAALLRRLDAPPKP